MSIYNSVVALSEVSEAIISAIALDVGYTTLGEVHGWRDSWVDYATIIKNFVEDPNGEKEHRAFVCVLLRVTDPNNDTSKKFREHPGFVKEEADERDPTYVVFTFVSPDHQAEPGSEDDFLETIREKYLAIAASEIDDVGSFNVRTPLDEYFLTMEADARTNGANELADSVFYLSKLFVKKFGSDRFSNGKMADDWITSRLFSSEGRQDLVQRLDAGYAENVGEVVDELVELARKETA